MDYNVHKVCRVCLEEGALTSIYSTDFAMSPYTMMMMVAKIHINRSDGLPAAICNNCIYRLGVAYHFKKECENNDCRLRQYLGLEPGYGICDAETNTDAQTVNKKVNSFPSLTQSMLDNDGDADNDDFPEVQRIISVKKRKRRSRYQRKPPEQHKKRGPKPLDKIPQTCYDCNKTFKCAAQLQMHIRTHTNEKPYACTHYGCNRRFAQKYNLQIHIRQHTGEKPYQCEICSKQFAALGNFQAHQKIHSGQRDHICPICQKGFYSAGDLTKHMVTHTGLKNHHCDICGKAFTRQRDMQAHKRKFHAELLAVDDDEVDDDDTGGDQTINVVTGGGGLATSALTGATGTNLADSNIFVMGTALNNNLKCSDCDKEFNTSSNSLGMHFRSHTNNLLNLPLSSQLQLQPVAMHPGHPPPHPHHHSHHYAHAPPHPAHDIHSHAATMQSNPSMAMIMHGPPHNPNASGQALGMMHAGQRLHPY